MVLLYQILLSLYIYKNFVLKLQSFIKFEYHTTIFNFCVQSLFLNIFFIAMCFKLKYHYFSYKAFYTLFNCIQPINSNIKIL